MTRSLTDQPVTKRLRKAILSGDFPPGARLVEAQLTDRYGVGRAGIRSALAELVKEGLVTHEANRGATVRSLSISEVIEIYEARAVVEGLMARHAAQQASSAEREQLESLIPGMRDAAASSSLTDFADRGRELHELVCRIGRHRVAGELIETLRNQSRHHPDRLSAMPGRPQQSLAEHIAIIEAIVARDPEAAEQAAHTHIESILDSIR